MNVWIPLNKPNRPTVACLVLQVLTSHNHLVIWLHNWKITKLKNYLIIKLPLWTPCILNTCKWLKEIPQILTIRPKMNNWSEGNDPKWKKLQNYSPRLGTVIVEAFSLRKRNSRRCTTIKRKKKFNIVSMMTKHDNDNNYGWWWWQ